MKELVVIIPMNELGENNIELLKKAVDSVPNDIKVLLSVPKSIKKKLNDVSDRIKVGKT